ncbi:MAG TPA: LysR family transcriptional regulator, partial [Bryobacteraceae bacterium]|nr:LysR family transcriptional regulator [Bryobacteraceae bacterium]
MDRAFRFSKFILLYLLISFGNAITKANPFAWLWHATGTAMELYSLKVFLTVANERSFSRAAERLLRTQPAV